MVISGNLFGLTILIQRSRAIPPNFVPRLPINFLGQCCVNYHRHGLLLEFDTSK